MTPPDARRFVLLLAALIIAGVALSGCGPKVNRLADQPDHVLPFPDAPPADASEWVRLRGELDNVRAVNARLDRELESAITARDTANAATWRRFGMFSWLLVVPGIGLIVTSFIFPLFAPARGAATILLGLGILFGALPHLLATYGPVVFYPLAVIGGAWVAIVAAINIAKRLKEARREKVDAKQEAKVAVAMLDPKQPDVGPMNLIATRAANSPAFAAALETALPDRPKE